MKAITLKFIHEKDTKGTHKFSEDAPEGKHAVGSLYIRKDAVDGECPSKLTVKITPAK